MRILVPVDASTHSVETVKYVLSTKALKENSEIELVTGLTTQPHTLPH